MKKLTFCVSSLWPFAMATVLLFGCRDGNKSVEDGSLTPTEALSAFELEPGFKIELLASEPLISSPVDMEIDEYGRLYVVEMPGYPLDNSHTGRVRMLSDKDGDGQMDESVVFATDLTFPNGILRWKNGVIVTDAPYVLYLEDRDGDGRSDVRDTLLTGFSLSNPHVNVNNPVYGLDNWIYLAHLGSIGTRKYAKEFGDKGSEVHFPEYPDGPRLPPNANGHTVCFRPGQRKLEMTSSRTQFGHAFDRWGRHILTHNQNHIYHEVIGAAYLKRNPDLLISNASENISDHGNETEVFQITSHPDRQLFTPMGMTTSSSGTTAYLGGIFPPPFDVNAVFVAESVSNLVHVDLLEDKGATFVAKRHRPSKEFLASKDSWCRPVNMYVGPDGALYVLDYYRRIIEHPEWMSDEAVAAGGLYDGHDKGRIYRITPEGAASAGWTKGLALGGESPVALVSHLSDKNIWWRLHAQRLLVDRSDASTVPALIKMAQNTSSPEGRLHALWTLEGMGSLSPELIMVALKDAQAGIRENAIKLAELHLADAGELASSLLALETDPDPKVRFQLLCTLGSIDTPGSAKVRESLLFSDLEDEWVQVAALSASSTQAATLLNTVLRRFEPGVAAYGNLVRRLSAGISASDGSEKVQQLLRKALMSKEEAWKSAMLNGLADGLKRRKDPVTLPPETQRKLIDTFFAHEDPSVRGSCLSLVNVTKIDNVSLQKQSMETAIAVAQNKTLENERRIDALNFLPLGDVTPYAGVLKGLVVAQEHPGVQSAALQALANVPGTDVSNYVLEKWESLTPATREVALQTFLSDAERIRVLLDAIESGRVAVEAISWKRRVQLMNHGREELRNRAQALLTKDEGEEVNRKYEKALKLEGRSSGGALVYKQNCAQCHQLRGGRGVVFGPDLGTVHNWLSKDLMANILDPGMSIAPGFDLWEVTMTDGEKVQGMITSETSAAIMLRVSPGVENEINRQAIQSIRGLKMSLMPGMAGQLNEQQMADLLVYLREGE